MNVFNDYLINTDLAYIVKTICEHGERVCYGKGDFFQREGDRSAYIGFIESGIFKYEKSDTSGESHVVGFSLDNDFVCDYTAFVRNEKATVDAVAMSDCVIFRLSYNTLMELQSMDENLKRAWCEGCEGFAITIYSRLLDFYCKTAQERYEKLLTWIPNILNHVMLKDIASFLNVKPETLSRIRKRMENENS